MLALDRSASSTGRWTDVDGRLHVPESIISRAEVSGYLGGEPALAALGLERDRLYQLLRPAEEMAKAAPTFHGAQLLNRHIPVSARAPQRDAVVGTVLNPRFEDPFLKAELVFWDAQAIERIEEMEARKAGQPLSAGYRFRVQMTPGTHEGQRYDGIMFDIIGNHVACVDSARVTTAMVGDGAPSHTAFQRAARIAPGLAKVTIGTVGYIV